jgi:DNA repair protein RadC
MKKVFTVRDWPRSARPRERLQKYGPEKLSDQELLMTVIGSGGRSKPVFEIVNELLKQFGNLRSIANASVEELYQIKGISFAKATQIKAALELGQRIIGRPSEEENTPPVIITPQDVEVLLKNKLRDKKKEYFIIICLDTRNRLIRDADISIGTLNASLVHPREVFKEAISASAASIIIAHNHPSGDPTPSDDDIKLTKRLIEAGKLVDIEVLDHIIITSQKSLSMKQLKII